MAWQQTHKEESKDRILQSAAMLLLIMALNKYLLTR